MPRSGDSPRSEATNTFGNPQTENPQPDAYFNNPGRNMLRGDQNVITNSITTITK